MYFVVHNQSPVEMGRCVYDTVVWNDVWEMSPRLSISKVLDLVSYQVSRRQPHR